MSRAGYRVVQPALRREDQTEVAVVIGDHRIHPNGLRDQLNGPLAAAALMGGNAEVMVGRGMIGFGLEDLPVARFRPVDPPGLMVFQAEAQDCLEIDGRPIVRRMLQGISPKSNPPPDFTVDPAKLKLETQFAAPDRQPENRWHRRRPGSPAEAWPGSRPPYPSSFSMGRPLRFQARMPPLTMATLVKPAFLRRRAPWAATF